MVTLERAFAYVDAVEVAPDRFAVRSSAGGGAWYIVGADALQRLANALEWYDAGDATAREIDDALRASWHTVMPTWWEPSQRCAYQCDDCGAVSCNEDEAAKRCNASSWSRITADLGTGEQRSGF
jgi:hypothetical protein